MNLAADANRVQALNATWCSLCAAMWQSRTDDPALSTVHSCALVCVSTVYPAVLTLKAGRNVGRKVALPI